MLNRIKNLKDFLSLFIDIKWVYRDLRGKLELELFPQIDRLSSNSENDILKKRMKRMAFYVPVSCLQYSNLCELNMDYKQFKALSIIGAIHPIYDSFFDEEGVRETDLEFMDRLLNGENYVPKNEREEMLLSLYRGLVDELNPENNQRFYDVLAKLHKSQIESLAMKDDVNAGTLKNISYDKGGNALLLYALIVNPHMSEREYKIVYDFGAWLQIFDDMEDAIEDKRNGIKTLITEGLLSERDIEREKNRVFGEIAQLEYPEKKKRDFLFAQYCIYIRGMFFKKIYDLYQKNKDSSIGKVKTFLKCMDLASKYSYRDYNNS